MIASRKGEGMAEIERPPRTHEYEQEHPDSPGQWWFVGNVVFKGTHNNNDTFVEIDEPHPYDIIDEAGKLKVSGDGSVYHGDVEWIGWWVKHGEQKLH